MAGLVLLAFAAIVFGPALNITFLGDDYLFLAKTRNAGLADLVSLHNTNFGWYRPWSREVHFWLMQKLFGLREAGFRATSVLLWLSALVGYAGVVSRFASRRTAWIATLGCAGLALWVAPLLWISGSQDLWMVALAMLALWLFTGGHAGWALLPYALALLSKETAVALPLLAFAYAWQVEGNRPRIAFVRVLPMAAMTLAWLLVHPVLLHRLTAHDMTPYASEHHPAMLELLARTILSVINANGLDQPFDPFAFNAWRTAGATLCLVAGALLARRVGDASPTNEELTTDEPARCARFGACWAIAGWLPLLQPSIGWHPYYGCLGAMGAWIALGGWLSRKDKLIVPVFVALGILHGVSGASRSWDWGSEWYQRRAGNLLALIRDQLRQQYPTLPSHSRVYFGSIPNNIGLVAGNSPAIRVWYDDPTLEAGFYSYYSPRTVGRPSGLDLFFHFDSTSGLHEVVAGPEDVPLAMRTDFNWERDHESLAMLLLSRGSPDLAAQQFEKLSQLPNRADALMYAAVCRERGGEPARAETLYAVARRRTGGTPAQIAAWAARLRASVPGP